MDPLTLAIILLAVCGVFCAVWAERHGASAALWFFLGLLLGLIGVVAVIVSMSNTPVRPPQSFQPPSWYPDPWGSGQLRWFDGQQWTAHLQGQQQPYYPQTQQIRPAQAVRPRRGGTHWN